jgi:hypothetical protein
VIVVGMSDEQRIYFFTYGGQSGVDPALMGLDLEQARPREVSVDQYDGFAVADLERARAEIPDAQRGRPVCRRP